MNDYEHKAMTYRDDIIEIIEKHEYAGNGKCMCGTAIGTSDRYTWTSDLPEHLANLITHRNELEGWITP